MSKLESMIRPRVVLRKFKGTVEDKTREIKAGEVVETDDWVNARALESTRAIRQLYWPERKDLVEVEGEDGITRLMVGDYVKGQSPGSSTVEAPQDRASSVAVETESDDPETPSPSEEEEEPEEEEDGLPEGYTVEEVGGGWYHLLDPDGAQVTDRPKRMKDLLAIATAHAEGD